MKSGKLSKEAARNVESYSVTKGEKFRLKDHDPADTNGVNSKEHADKILARRVGLLSEMQERLYRPRFASCAERLGVREAHSAK